MCVCVKREIDRKISRRFLWEKEKRKKCVQRLRGPKKWRESE